MPVIVMFMMSAASSKCEELEHLDMFWPEGAKVLKTCICVAK